MKKNLFEIIINWIARKSLWLKENQGERVLKGLAICILCAFAVRFTALCIFDCYEYKDKEAYRTVGVTETSEMRGSITDRNGNTLASSTPSYNLVFSPYDILEYDEIAELEAKLEKRHSKKKKEEIKTEIAELEKKGEIKAEQIAYTLSCFDETQTKDEILENIHKAFDYDSDIADEDKIGERYYVVLYNIDESEKNSFLAFIDAYNKSIDDEEDAYYDMLDKLYSSPMGKVFRKVKNFLNISLTDEELDLNLKITENEDFYFETQQKRIYPYNQTASLVLGYVNDHGVALTGLETYYDSELSGVADRRVTGQGVWTIITSVFDNQYEGTAAVNLKTTLDVNIQQIVEKEIKKTQAETNAESVYAVVMKTQTGEILAMANTPGYDPSDPDTANDTELNYYKYLAEHPETDETEDETEEETTDSSEFNLVDIQEQEEEAKKEQETPTCGTVYERTNNLSITSPLYPGSIYKAFLVAGALEEGMTINYYCSGSYTIPDSAVYAGGPDRTITCADNGVHNECGAERLLVKSCNICAAQLGLDMGSETFFKYYQAFGFTEKTGIDLPGGDTEPSSSLYYTEYDTTSLATCSFGQNNKISALQIALAMSALGNGGKLMTPYVVSEQVDSDGNVVSKTEPTVKRQVVSESVANTMKSYLESVVDGGSGSNASLEHYRVSGKTGTSQIKNSDEETIGYVASFAGFAPTSDPEITVVVNIIDPKSETGTTTEILASEIAAPLAGNILGQSLEYLGIAYDK